MNASELPDGALLDALRQTITAREKTSVTAVRDLAYGDLFDLADLPTDVWEQLDPDTRRRAEHALARVQSESHTDGPWWRLDTSYGFFRIDPAHTVAVVRNEPHPFGSRSMR